MNAQIAIKWSNLVTDIILYHIIFFWLARHFVQLINSIVEKKKQKGYRFQFLMSRSSYCKKTWSLSLRTKRFTYSFAQNYNRVCTAKKRSFKYFWYLRNVQLVNISSTLSREYFSWSPFSNSSTKPTLFSIHWRTQCARHVFVMAIFEKHLNKKVAFETEV